MTCKMPTVLLVEDDDGVRAVLRLMLLRRGHRVLAAAGGLEALELAGRYAHPIDLVLTDVVMPHLSSRQMVEQLKRKRPALRVLYMSGYSEEVTERFGISPAAGNFLRKPFTAEALACKIREVLRETKALPRGRAPKPGRRRDRQPSIALVGSR